MARSRRAGMRLAHLDEEYSALSDADIAAIAHYLAGALVARLP